MSRLSPSKQTPAARQAHRTQQAHKRRLPSLQPRLGQPLHGLTANELARFQAGLIAFRHRYTPEEGLGPIHNLFSCAACHSNPVGGSGTLTVTLFGQIAENSFDPLKALGGPLLQSETIRKGCEEVVPAEANISAQRITTSILGAGLIEAIPDEAIQACAEHSPDMTRGRVHWVHAIEDPPHAPRRVGRFGWKAQVATVVSFTASAALFELGITNSYLPKESAPNGYANLLTYCDTVPDPEDRPDTHGVDRITRMTDYQRYLAPPPQTPRSGMAGETVFKKLGCADCHVPSLTTTDRPDLEKPLRHQRIKPYSDFLLHDMGPSSDGIAQGDASVGEMRTAPLWGFRIRFPTWHDGRVTGATVRDRLIRSTLLHAGSATAAVEKFRALSKKDMDRLVAFIDSLGRVEFDKDGDNDVDLADFQALLICFGGYRPAMYTPDDPCSISDIDQDGDVDLVDFGLFQRAFTGRQYGSAVVAP